MTNSIPLPDLNLLLQKLEARQLLRPFAFSLSLLTQKLGFSDTFGAFLAGALLAETNRPSRGFLLGLFFVTTGTTIDMEVMFRIWPNVLTLLAGLIVIKTSIITALGPRVGLGFLLSQGGEFAFVVFSLANRSFFFLTVLPLELNKLLIIVVVLSMALTPTLNQHGRKAADFIDEKLGNEENVDEELKFNVKESVVLIGFGQMGQWFHIEFAGAGELLVNAIGLRLSGVDSDLVGWPYIGFDLNPAVVKEDGVDLATTLKIAYYYRRGKKLDYVYDYTLPTPFELKEFEQSQRLLAAVVSPVFLSTLDNGTVERTLGEIPSTGPVLYVMLSPTVL
ncbi:unnamed protein product [Eruca vesicaria subsp. sativa]|uniref:Cation/H+ exchanger transmembrane domain-containing protein n=1 Tax=Eruca vesicaria subsp. sativa TaxID=29727 RepID=A0ABC8IVI9_ERUVS|nr:unnamed protein product [Eruca vesicaria subsp. sativa]